MGSDYRGPMNTLSTFLLTMNMSLKHLRNEPSMKRPVSEFPSWLHFTLAYALLYTAIDG